MAPLNSSIGWGQFGQAPYMQIMPTISWSWNLDGRPFTHDREVVIHRTVHLPVAEKGA
jgi:pyridoxamine 5'-phosphate oxidase family protein